MVAASPSPSGGSSESRSPSAANAAWASAMRTPGWTSAVMSPAFSSTIEASPAVRSSTSASTGLPQPSFVPPPRTRTGRRSPAQARTRSATSRSQDGVSMLAAPTDISEPFGQAGLLERVLAVGTRHLAAQARRRHDLAGVRAAVGVERAAQVLERREVVGSEHLRHVTHLVDADAVLAGQRAARVEARLEDLPRDLLGLLGLALDLRVVTDEGVQVAV